MDNLSHSLIGLIAGESVAQTTRVRDSGLSQQSRRALLVTLFVVGGNLPDLDLIYSFRGLADSTGAKLDYMLQHRGYTHTVLGCVILALLLYLAVLLWQRRRAVVLTRRDRAVLAGAALCAVLLHLAMDFLNSYGVHPFWPLQNRWYYGDSVFIVEPLYWVAAAPLLFVVRSAPARLAVGLALVAALALCWFSQRVLAVWCVGLGALLLVLLVVGARASQRAATLTSAVVMSAVTVMFLAAGGVAAQRVEAIAAGELPAGRVLDHVLTPAPMNPLCWDVLLLETSGDRYTVRSGVLSNLPVLLPAQRCPGASGDRAPMAPLQPLAAAATGVAGLLGPASASVRSDPRELIWYGEFTMSRALLSELVASHCDAAALMQFIRVPFASGLGRGWVMGDLRFAAERGGGLATIVLGPPEWGECRRSVPWVAPRADLLQQGGASRKEGDIR